MEESYSMPSDEYEHYASVLLSFREYTSYMLHELHRRKTHISRLPESHRAILKALPTSTINSMARLLTAIQGSQRFLDEVCHVQAAMGPAVELPAKDAKPAKTFTSPIHHFSKLESTLHQCVRDWSTEAKEERNRCYGPILQNLKDYLPVSASNRNLQRVLVPGAGLGRLALEIAALGYATQGNEFSYQMLFTSNFLLNCSRTEEQFVIHPWLHNPSNTLSIEDATRPVRIPDVCPASLLQTQEDGSPPDFSMAAGEFLEVYSNDTACWDCIVTCFFIDAAPNALDYIEAFERMLKPGGLWINLGPLLYHWQNSNGDDDIRYEQSVEFTYEEIKHAMTSSFNFEILMENQKECLYTCNLRSLMKTVYNCVHFVARKK